MLADIQGEVRFKEPLSFHTSLRIGGPADIFVVPQDLDDIRRALNFAAREQLPVAVVGGGNNLLICDEGFHGVVIRLEGALGRTEFRGEEAIAGAGVSLSSLIREAAARNLGGIESLTGIPATIGGALAMNAGSPEGVISDFVSTAYFLHPDGSTGEWKSGNGTASSRKPCFPPGAVIVGCRMHFTKRLCAEIQRDLRQRIKVRRHNNPMALATAGPIWNDPPTESVARILKEAGLSAKKIGEAEISAKQPNFIVNRGGASSRDVLGLMEIAHERVYARFGFELRSRIQIIRS